MQKFKDARRKFYKFNAPRCVPKCAVSETQPVAAGAVAILSCVRSALNPAEAKF